MAISSRWNRLEGKDPESNKVFCEFLATIDFERLIHTAAVIRGVDRSSPKIDPAAYQRGSLNVVFEILFADGVSWVVRLGLPQPACFPVSKEPPEAWLRRRKYTTKSEIDTQQFVREKTSIPVPEIFHFDLSYDGTGVGAPYIIMEGFTGLRLPEFQKLPPEYQERIFPQVARVIIQLSNLTFPKIGLLRVNKEKIVAPRDWYDSFGFRHPPCRSSSAYYERVYGLVRARTLSSKDLDEKAVAWIYDRCSMYIRRIFGTQGPFPLCHGDLWSGNFLWDNDLNLVAVIDWTNTMAMPWEYSAMIQELYLEMTEEVQLARQKFAHILWTEEMRLGRMRRVSDLFSLPATQILCLIKDVNRSIPEASFLVPRLFGLMPGITDVKFLDYISPNFIERCTRYRENIKKGIPTVWVSYRDINCLRRENQVG